MESNFQNSQNTFQLKTPILFLVFNRPDLTYKVFKKICEVKPCKLYISSDGPRKKNNIDIKIVSEIRKYLLNNIDWDCEIKTLFRDTNLGCRLAVSSAITWFFENEEEGIILEDDCLPTKAFFDYCNFALDKYKNNYKVYSISGTNLLSGKINESVFSLHGSIWGWASWRRAWKNYDVDNKEISFMDCFYYACSFLELINIYKIRKKIKEKLYNSWDYQWLFTRISNRGLTLMPKDNYIKNIGFKIGTHHKNEVAFNYPESSNFFDKKNFKLPEIKRSKKYDYLLFKYRKQKNNSFNIKFKNFIFKLLGKV